MAIISFLALASLALSIGHATLVYNNLTSPVHATIYLPDRYYENRWQSEQSVPFKLTVNTCSPASILAPHSFLQLPANTQPRLESISSAATRIF